MNTSPEFQLYLNNAKGHTNLLQFLPPSKTTLIGAGESQHSSVIKEEQALEARLWGLEQ